MNESREVPVHWVHHLFDAPAFHINHIQQWSVEQDKMVELAESITYESDEQFVQKMSVIKESYFKDRDSDSVEDTRQELTEAMSSTEELDEEQGEVKSDPQMERYTSAIRRVQRIVT